MNFLVKRILTPMVIAMMVISIAVLIYLPFYAYAVNTCLRDGYNCARIEFPAGIVCEHKEGRP